MSEINIVNNEDDNTPDIVTLSDENGEQTEFEVIGTLDRDDSVYYALVPVIDSDNLGEIDGELIILKTVTEDGEEFLATIEDDVEYFDIAELFKDELSEFYEIEN